MQTKQQTAAQNIEKRLLGMLAELGGQSVKEDDIVREGTKFIIPGTMNELDAMRFLKKHIESQREETEFQREFRFRPFDGAHALQAAMKKVFGTAGIPKATFSMFTGKQPPPMISINVGPNRTEQVPWGQLQFPPIEGTITLGAKEHPEFGDLFHLSVVAPRKYAPHVEGLFKVVQEELEINSIYRGKPIDGSYEFLDLTGVDRKTVIYKEEVEIQLEANLWAHLRYTSKMKELGIPLKRTVLLEGPYGVGKTLTAHLTAKIAQENGWTFLQCRPKKDDLEAVIQTARLYPPAVVFFEDIDVISSGEQDRDGVTRLLDIFDGITAKGTELVGVMTTNHKEKIHKGMIRPGRLDAVIHMSQLDQKGIEELIVATIDADKLGDIDYEVVGQEMSEFLPAFIKEALDRTQTYAITRGAGDFAKIETEDLVNSAHQMQEHKALMDRAHEGKERDPLSVAVGRVVGGAMEQVLHDNTKMEIKLPQINEEEGEGKMVGQGKPVD